MTRKEGEGKTLGKALALGLGAILALAIAILCIFL